MTTTVLDRDQWLEMPEPSKDETDYDGRTLLCGFIDTPIGCFGVVKHSLGLVQCAFGDHMDDLSYPMIQTYSPDWYIMRDDRVAAEVWENAMSYKPQPLSFCVSGTPFQLSAWKALRHVPVGKTFSYLEFATVMGKAWAVRAIATAIANNPFALVVPCHRIIRADGRYGEYRWGAQRKEWLIHNELKHLYGEFAF